MYIPFDHTNCGNELVSRAIALWQVDDVSAASICLLKAFRDENADAMFFLGMMHHFGWSGYQSLTSAGFLYEKASQLKHSKAIVAWADVLDSEGRSQEAYELYLSAMQLNNSQATYEVGHRLLQGYHVTKDEKQAITLLKKAMRMGNLPATLTLADCYAEGVAVEKNMDRAKQFYTMVVHYFEEEYGEHLVITDIEKIKRLGFIYGLDVDFSAYQQARQSLERLNQPSPKKNNPFIAFYVKHPSLCLSILSSIACMTIVGYLMNLLLSSGFFKTLAAMASSVLTGVSTYQALQPYQEQLKKWF
jgi:tetratricopeptide (TPR) repeat protein